MRDNLGNILNHGDCITEDVMLKYLEGTLPPMEQHRVEKHLLGCEICTDMFEGLSMQPIGSVRADLDDLDKRIDARVNRGTGRVVSMPMIYRVAAAIALFALFGGGFYYLQSLKRSEKIFAENFEPYRDTTNSRLLVTQAPNQETETVPKAEEKQAPAKSAKPDTKKNKKEIAIAATGSNAQADAATKPGAGNTVMQPMAVPANVEQIKDKEIAEEISVKTKDGKSTTSDESPLREKSGDAVSKNNASVETTESVKQLEKKHESYSSAGKRSGKTLSAEAPGVPSASPEPADHDRNMTTSLIKEGVKSYEEKNYPAAISTFQKILEKEPRNTEALFYSGVSRLSLHEYDAAIDLLESVLKNSPDKFSDAAKWYLSLAYIKKNKRSKAKKILEELAGGTSEYQPGAQKALEDLK